MSDIKVERIKYNFSAKTIVEGIEYTIIWDFIKDYLSRREIMEIVEVYDSSGNRDSLEESVKWSTVRKATADFLEEVSLGEYERSSISSEEEE